MRYAHLLASAPEAVYAWAKRLVDDLNRSAGAPSVDVVPASVDDAGTMSSEDFVKLRGIESGATRNRADAFLLERDHHTGSQKAATISDFGSTVTERVANMLQAGNGVLLAYNPINGKLRISSGGSGVASFNDRAGIVTLTTADVTDALGYIPTSITGFTGVQSIAAIKAALAFTKADVGLGNVDNTADAAKNVLSATKLTTPRTISITGDVAWSVSFDGSGNVTSAGTIQANAVSFSKFVAATQKALVGANAAGNFQEITIGSGLSLSGGVLTATGSGGTVTNVTATAPLTSTGGATPNIAVTAAPLTKVDDTNVTLTLAGAPALALLAGVSITIGWAGTLSVARGGTGAGAASGAAIDNISGWSSTGHLVRTGAGTYAFRSLTGTANQISVSNGSGVSGNPTISLPSALVLPGTLDVTGRAIMTVADGAYGTSNASPGGSHRIYPYFDAASGALDVAFTPAFAYAPRSFDGLRQRFLTSGTLRATVEDTGIWPGADNSYYLGKNSASSPFAWKGLILKDQVTGTYYRLDIQSGTIVLTSL